MKKRLAAANQSTATDEPAANQSGHAHTANYSHSAAFHVETKLSSKFQNSWLLDSATDTHVCNDCSRFIQTSEALDRTCLYARKTSYSILGYGMVYINIQTPDRTTTI